MLKKFPCFRFYGTPKFSSVALTTVRRGHLQHFVEQRTLRSSGVSASYPGAKLEHRIFCTIHVLFNFHSFPGATRLKLSPLQL